MKRVIKTCRRVEASDSNKSSRSEALSIAEALKFVLEDMDDTDFHKMTQRCPAFYKELSDFITYN